MALLESSTRDANSSMALLESPAQDDKTQDAWRSVYQTLR
jgi:hypothetical protein